MRHVEKMHDLACGGFFQRTFKIISLEKKKLKEISSLFSTARITDIYVYVWKLKQNFALFFSVIFGIFWKLKPCRWLKSSEPTVPDTVWQVTL